jgi:hypothetical protein
VELLATGDEKNGGVEARVSLRGWRRRIRMLVLERRP